MALIPPFAPVTVLYVLIRWKAKPWVPIAYGRFFRPKRNGYAIPLTRHDFRRFLSFPFLHPHSSRYGVSNSRILLD